LKHLLGAVMKKTFALLSLFTLILMGTSCASIVKGKTTLMVISSNVTGADVVIDGVVVGQTPFTGDVISNSGENGKLELKKPGYKTHTQVLLSRTSNYFWANIIFGGPFGSSTDSSTGAMYEYAPNQFMIELQKEGTVSLLELEENQKASKLRYFVLLNYDRLSKEIAQGNGEYLDSIYSFYPQKQKEEVNLFLKEKLKTAKSQADFANNISKDV
jgi:hypothetical protein